MEGCSEHISTTAQLASSSGFLFFGLLTSLHCVGMCGPLSTIICQSRNDKTHFGQIRPLSLYHVSRLIGYCTVVALLYSFGQTAFSWLPRSLLIWTMVGLLALYGLGVSLPMQAQLTWIQSALLKRISRTPNAWKPLCIGLLSPLLPCGLLYAAFAAALLAPSLSLATLWIAAFAFGTIPLLFASQMGIHALAGSALLPRRDIVLRTSALITVGFLIWMNH